MRLLFLLHLQLVSATFRRDAEFQVSCVDRKTPTEKRGWVLFCFVFSFNLIP